ncbi:BET1 homolog [Lineus longissimus]|uniref:BET1 homolog n=1 Tax=Lineus longissimus TaxID=88925 RepID=UPI002B4DE8A7
MRRAHAAEASYAAANGNNQMVEDENERLEENLQFKVKALKSLSIDIGTEVKYQNKMLKDMDEDFDNSGGILKATMGRLGAIARSGGNRFIWSLLLFALLVFLVCWLIIKFR